MQFSQSDDFIIKDLFVKGGSDNEPVYLSVDTPYEIDDKQLCKVTWQVEAQNTDENYWLTPYCFEDLESNPPPAPKGTIIVLDGKQDRIDEFKSYGFSTLIVWDYEMSNLNKVIDRIKEFERGE